MKKDISINTFILLYSHPLFRIKHTFLKSLEEQTDMVAIRDGMMHGYGERHHFSVAFVKDSSRLQYRKIVTAAAVRHGSVARKLRPRQHTDYVIVFGEIGLCDNSVIACVLPLVFHIIAIEGLKIRVVFRP
ncbi:hypothetical protein SDC9_208672 [bioreactor metagenome]|uniref:Uncharacterized protein n=1 Tax=bioreactor metagenome TaxID=1076179 RepID=A0A645JE35_9ZZZZ